MNNTIVINYVPGVPSVTLRREYVDFCDDKNCPALVLYALGYMHSKNANKIYEKWKNSGEKTPEPVYREKDLYIQVSINAIIKQIVDEYKSDMVAKAIDFLVEKKVLRIVHGENFRKNKARTYQLYPEVLNEFLDNKYRSERTSPFLVNTMRRDATKKEFEASKETEVSADNFYPNSEKSSSPTSKNRCNRHKEERHKHKDPSFIRKDFIKEGGTDHPSSREEDKDVEQSLFPSQDVEALFNHWNMLGKPLSIHRADPTKKTFQRSILALQKALKSHSVEYIADTMDTYIKLLNYSDRKFDDHTPGAVISLPEFFKFSENTESRMLTSKPLITVENWFTTCQKPWDELLLEFGKFDKDENPNVTAALIKSYKTEVENRDFSVTETNIFIKAARLVVQLHCENNKKFDWKLHSHEKERPDWFAHHLIKAVVEDAQDKSFIAPSWLLSERTRKVRLRKHFIKCGLLWQFEDVAKPVNIETPKPVEPAKRVQGVIGRLTDEPTRKPAPMIKTGPAPVNDGPTRRPVAIPKSDKPIDPNAGRVRRHLNSMGSRCKAKSWESMSWEERLADLALRR